MSSEAQTVSLRRQFGLPLVRCQGCRALARLLAFDRQGKPLVSCATPGCPGDWTVQRHRA